MSGKLSSRSEWALPLNEVSALALRKLPSGASELVAVSDEDYDVVTVKLDNNHGPAETAHHLLRKQLPERVISTPEGSEFEGVACDGDGLVFILQEGPARVLAVSPDFQALRQTIQLSVDPDEPGFGHEWCDRGDATNARGEALLLLRAGRLLVIKQRDPVRFIEFGPASAEPRGLGPDTYLGVDESFQLPQGQVADFAVLASWPLHSEAEDRFDGLNEVAVGDDGRVYVLSSRSRRIGRLEKRIRADEDGVRVAEEWTLPDRLPGGKDGRPEGLALLNGLRPLISIDTKEPGDNLVRLEGLEPPA